MNIARKPKSPIKSAARTLRVFEVFDEQRRALNVSEIAQYVGIPQSSATELTKSLVELGYLARQPNSRSYLPTLRISVLGKWIESSSVVHGSILQLMQDLHDAVADTIILGVEHGTKVQYAHIVASESELRMHPTEGSMRNICRANLGLMLLTKKDDEDIERLVRRINVEEPDSPPLDPHEVLTWVTQARRDSYSALVGQLTEGAGVYAVLLPQIEGQQTMALGIGAPAHRFYENLTHFKESMSQVISRYF